MKIFPARDIGKMFARLSEELPDTGAVTEKHTNLPYGENPRQAIDIYLPENRGEKPVPAVIFLHGGGWQSGDRADAQMLPVFRLLKCGYAVISAGYRLSDTVTFPRNLYDVKAALRFVSDNAQRYGIDSERLFLSGASAGGQLALLAAFTLGQAVYDGARGADGRFTAGADCSELKLAGVIAFYPPTDFLTQDAQFEQMDIPRAEPESPDRLSGADIMFGAKMTASPELVRFVNPIDSVHAKVPPTLLLHGWLDPIVPALQSETLHEKITAVCGAGRSECRITADGILHADPDFAKPEWTEIILRFLERA
ncbi:MAG: alpha/beta hydrolase [Oscillospiraceae bacterium]|jgi:acetyl esterase/lipase|nr:alpha/beta hydrolase [Oscillospiraceae bacterium]